MRRVCTFVLGISMVFFTLDSTLAIAQSRTDSQIDAIAKPLAYDVISIKPSDPDAHSRWHRMTVDGLSMNVPLKTLIFTAYSILTDNQISGLPGWASSEQFDVEAKMDPDAAAALAKLPQDVQSEQRRAMLRTLLADRFGLKVHHETKELRVYKLVIAKDGLKMKQTPANARKRVNINRGQLTGHGITVGSLVVYLSGALGLPVVDKTGLTGNYDLNLRWTPDDASIPPQTSRAVPDSGPSIFTALQQKLGLKLEPSKEPTDTIVVDHLERPSEN